MGLFTVPNSVKAITPLVGQILVESETRHRQDEVTELHLFYNRPTSGAVYAPVCQRLLPLDEGWRRKLAELPWPTGTLPEVMGSGTATLRALVREYLFISLFRACAESLASENASRLAAMERADQNIDELLESSPRHVPPSASERHRRGAVRRHRRLRSAGRTDAPISPPCRAGEPRQVKALSARPGRRSSFARPRQACKGPPRAPRAAQSRRSSRTRHARRDCAAGAATRTRSTHQAGMHSRSPATGARRYVMATPRNSRAALEQPACRLPPQ